MKYFIEKFNTWQKDLFFLALLNGSILLSASGLSDLAGMIFLVVFPGLLIQRLINHKFASGWESLVHIVALSISFDMAAGLAANTVLPFLGVDQPLSRLPILIFFDLWLLVLIVANGYLKRNGYALCCNWLEKADFRKSAGYLLFGIFPLGAIAGATILNNGGANWVTLITIFLIAAFWFYLLAAKKLKEENSIVTGIYFSALALLFTMSMRSWHISGWDISGEFQVFQRTQADMHWAMSQLQDAYNACLSITILPTIFSDFTKIGAEYIYKFIFQFIFALMPVVIFYFARIFLKTRGAILAVMMFIGQAVFSNGMPALIRQEFGLLFFGLILLTIFHPKISDKKRSWLLIIYGLSLVFSHYSTLYIAIFLLAAALLLNYSVYFLRKIIPGLLPADFSFSIKLWYLALLAGITFFWGGVFTGTSNNLTGFLSYSRANIAETFSVDTLNQALKQVLTPYPHFENFEKYVAEETSSFRAANPGMNFYDEQLIQQEPLTRSTFAQVPGLFGSSAQKIAGRIFQILKLMLNNLFVLIGLFLLIYRWYKQKFLFSEVIFLAIGGFLLLFLLLFLPAALAEYNIDRLYFQLLMVWSFLNVSGGVGMLYFLSERFRFGVLAFAYGLLLIFYNAGFASFFGGTPLMSTHNYGADFEKFYVFDSEVSAAQWLGREHQEIPVYVNSAGFNRLRAFGNVEKHKIFMTMLPAVMDQDSYVFFTHMNVSAGLSSYLFNNEEYAHTVPENFVNNNKNLIYNNGTAKVYR